MGNEMMTLVFALLSFWCLAVISLADAREGATPTGRGDVAFAFALAAAALACVVRALPVPAVTCGIACTSLVVAAAADARTGYLYDVVTLPTLVLTCGLVMLSGNIVSGACGVGAILATFGLPYLLSKGRWLGLGDLKAMLPIGAAFGAYQAEVATLIACISGIAVALSRRGTARRARLAFGPHLALGSVATLAFGDTIARHAGVL